MNRIIKMTLPVVLTFWSVVVLAAMQPLDEHELADTYGQAIFEVTDQVVNQDGGADLRMLRMTMGARIEINANIEELALGRYWRPEGTNCIGGANGQVCYNNIIPASYNDNINWACTGNPCGNVGLSDSDYLSSEKTHNVGEKPFFDYPGGFEPDGGVDIKLRDVTMGQIRDKGNGQYEMLPFVQENPYLEFAFDETSGARKLVGFRLGFENTVGYQGNIIDVISGFIRPTITADSKLLGLNVGAIKLEAFLGGSRAIGFLDKNTMTLDATGGLTGLLVSDRESLIEQSPHAQLFPVQSIFLDNTPSFFFSVGTRSIQWSPTQGFSPEISRPGFWLNLGGDGGLIAETQKGSHPNNYFPGHPNYPIYSANENYGDVANLPSWSQTYRNNGY